VGVDQKNAHVGARLEDFPQDQDDAARLADAGGSEDGEMLVQQFVDPHQRADRIVVLQIPDFDRAGIGDLVDQPQPLAGQQSGPIADRRIACHTPLECRARLVLLDLAHEIDPGGRVIATLARRRRNLDRYVRDDPDKQRFAGSDLEESPDSRQRVICARLFLGQEPDGGLRAGHCQDMAYRLLRLLRPRQLAPDLPEVHSRPLSLYPALGAACRSSPKNGARTSYIGLSGRFAAVRGEQRVNHRSRHRFGARFK